MHADDVDLTAGIAEEGAEATSDDAERAFAGAAIWLPVVHRNDEEQVVCIGGDVRLPEILKVVIVGRRASSLDLGEDPASAIEPEEEVRASLGDETVLRGQDDFFTETQLVVKHLGDELLNRRALRVEDVRRGNLFAIVVDRLGEALGAEKLVPWCRCDLSLTAY
jgi:hypothetical protein